MLLLTISHNITLSLGVKRLSCNSHFHLLTCTCVEARSRAKLWSLFCCCSNRPYEKQTDIQSMPLLPLLCIQGKTKHCRKYNHSPEQNLSFFELKIRQQNKEWLVLFFIIIIIIIININYYFYKKQYYCPCMLFTVSCWNYYLHCLTVMRQLTTNEIT